MEGELVFAHEIGHSYGAMHDPLNYECAPSAERGGLYLVNKFAVSGMMPNHYVSPPLSYIMPIV